MKYLVIPDVHGRDGWKKYTLDFLEVGTEGKVVFLGDYLDSFDVPDKPMMDTFRDVINLKNVYGNRVILLIGNHDFPYIYLSYNCSGHRLSLRKEAHELFAKYADCFQLAYQVGNTLFAHAGLSTAWLDYNRREIEAHLHTSVEAFVEESSYANLLNVIHFTFGMHKIIWQVSSRSGGHDRVDGPIWIRPNDLFLDMMKGINQVVGHTQINSGKSVTQANPNGDTITLTDCMGNTDWEPLVLDL